MLAGDAQLAAFVAKAIEFGITDRDRLARGCTQTV
jgi:hypothetical protein